MCATSNTREPQSGMGELLVELRKERGLKQREVAPEIGLTVPTLSSYERENSSPDYSTLIRICDYYNVSADYLLGRVRSRRIFSVDAVTLHADKLNAQECLGYLNKMNQMESELHRRLELIVAQQHKPKRR